MALAGGSAQAAGVTLDTCRGPAGFEHGQVWAMQRAGQVGDGEDKEWGNMALRDGLLAFCCLGSRWPKSLGHRLWTPSQNTSPKLAGIGRIPMLRHCLPPGSSCIPHPTAQVLGCPDHRNDPRAGTRLL